MSLRTRPRVRIGQTLEPLYRCGDVGEVDKTIRRCRPDVTTMKRRRCRNLLEATYKGADVREVDVAVRECAGAVPNHVAPRRGGASHGISGKTPFPVP